MKKLIAACLLVCPLVATSAFAQDASAPKANSAQQEKMKICNAEAVGKTGDERKAFMKQCLSNKPVASGTPQQQKMTNCNKEAAGKKGDERRAFMKDCLSA